MLKFMAGILLGVALFGIVVHVSRGQVATAEVKNKGIKQGDQTTMVVSLDRASNIEGTLKVYALSQDGVGQFELACGLPKGASVCTASNRLPLDAKVGKWSIKKVTFQGVFPTNPEKELTTTGETSFDVAPLGEIVYPHSAAVSDIK